jgi:hypothetical protein
MPSLDYSRFEAIVDSDDEPVRAADEDVEERKELFPDGFDRKLGESLQKAIADARLPPPEKDEDSHSFARASGARDTLVKLTADERKILVKFVEVQHREGTNVTRHDQIIHFLQAHPWLLEQKALDGAAAASHKEYGDAKTHLAWLQALNTLNACAPAGPVMFFGDVCTPTTEEARDKRMKYEQSWFAKKYIVERIMGPVPEMPDDPLDNVSWYSILGLLVALIAIMVYMVRMIPS